MTETQEAIGQDVGTTLVNKCVDFCKRKRIAPKDMLLNREVAIHERNLRHLITELRFNIVLPKILRLMHMAVGVDDFKIFSHKWLRFVARIRMESRRC